MLVDGRPHLSVRLGGLAAVALALMLPVLDRVSKNISRRCFVISNFFLDPGSCFVVAEPWSLGAGDWRGGLPQLGLDHPARFPNAATFSTASLSSNPAR